MHKPSSDWIGFFYPGFSTSEVALKALGEGIDFTRD